MMLMMRKKEGKRRWEREEKRESPSWLWRGPLGTLFSQRRQTKQKEKKDRAAFFKWKSVGKKGSSSSLGFPFLSPSLSLITNANAFITFFPSFAFFPSQVWLKLYWLRNQSDKHSSKRMQVGHKHHQEQPLPPHHWRRANEEEPERRRRSFFFFSPPSFSSSLLFLVLSLEAPFKRLLRRGLRLRFLRPPLLAEAAV